ncbi:MAG: roadblock/LC7 domain-containing protein, partial [Promethearchaeota archaeon]
MVKSELIMDEETKLNILDELKEIEEVNGVEGALLLKLDTLTIIASTKEMDLSEDILWEIGVLRDSFGQFSRNIKHDEVLDMMLEGDNGFIFMYNLPYNYALLVLGPSDIHLGYFKLGMFDIVKRIKQKVTDYEEELIRIKKKIEEERRRREEEERRRREEEERRRREEEERRRREEEERRKREEEERRKREEEERRRREEEERRKREEEERRKREEEERRKREEEWLRKEK